MAAWASVALPLASAVAAQPVLGRPAGTAACPTKSVAIDPHRRDGYRSSFAWPTVLEARRGAAVESACLRIVGLDGLSTIQTRRGSQISVNGGRFVSGPVAIREGDAVRLRSMAPQVADAETTEQLLFDGERQLASFTVRARNDDRAPRLFSVGPGLPWRELGEVAPLLRAGDVVELHPGVYRPVEFTRAGSVGAPITLRGVGPGRPVVEGGERTLQLNGAHHMVVEGLEVRGGSQMCVRTMAHRVLLRDLYVHGCARHGVLGADFGSGDLTLDQVEIARCGGQPAGEHTKHAAYVATDRDQFPDAVFRVVRSYIHDFRGSAVKSRSARTELHYNWIEAPADPQSLYVVELYGFEEYLTDAPLHSDVVGNVFVLRGRFGFRFGGDGTGTSRGRVRLANNTVFVGSGLDGAFLIRLFQQLDAVYLLNNAFVRLGPGPSAVQLFRDDLSASGGWVSGRMKIAGDRNYLFTGIRMSDAVARGLQGTLSDEAVTVRSTAAGSPDAGVPAFSVLHRSGRPLSTVAPGFELPAPLLDLQWRAPERAPASGRRLVPSGRIGERDMNIGAH